MRYKGKACEIVGEKEVFGQRIAWIRLMVDSSFHEVPYDELEESTTYFSMPYLALYQLLQKLKTKLLERTFWLLTKVA